MSLFKKTVLKKGPSKPPPARKKQEQSAAAWDKKPAPHVIISQKEIRNDLKKHAMKKAEESIVIEEYEEVMEPLSEREQEKEVARDLEKLKRTNPELYDTIYEKTRAEDALKKSATRNRIKKSIITTGGFIILSIPLALDMIQGEFSRMTDYKFALFMISALWFGVLKGLTVQYKVGTLVFILWMNINPSMANLLKFGYKKYLLEIGAILLCFFAVETATKIITPEFRIKKRRPGKAPANGSPQLLLSLWQWLPSMPSTTGRSSRMKPGGCSIELSTM